MQTHKQTLTHTRAHTHTHTHAHTHARTHARTHRSALQVVSPSALYGGMAPKEVWVPPGQWLELPTGAVVTGGADL